MLSGFRIFFSMCVGLALVLVFGLVRLFTREAEDLHRDMGVTKP